LVGYLLDATVPFSFPFPFFLSANFSGFFLVSFLGDKRIALLAFFCADAIVKNIFKFYFNEIKFKMGRPERKRSSDSPKGR
jgi:hypothetical protein